MEWKLLINNDILHSSPLCKNKKRNKIQQNSHNEIISTQNTKNMSGRLIVPMSVVTVPMFIIDDIL